MEGLKPQNSTSANGLVVQLIDAAPGPTLTIVIGAVVALYLLNVLATPRVYPGEPPLIKPTIPLIGHIIGLFWHKEQYHNVVS